MNFKNIVWFIKAIKAILFFFGFSEVNSTWLITSELANQRVRKVLFTCVVYTKTHDLDLLSLSFLTWLKQFPDPTINTQSLITSATLIRNSPNSSLSSGIPCYKMKHKVIELTYHCCNNVM